MKKLKLIYNPFSGSKSFTIYLDEVIEVFQRAGYETHIFKALERGDIETHIKNMEKGFYDIIVSSGGDGTINTVINAMLENNHDIPLGIIPSGTANDFASYLKIPSSVIDAVNVIANKNIVPCDIGNVNGKYFINVCSAGLLTNISQQIDDDLKNMFGKMAYYIKGLGQIPSFMPLPMRITNSHESFEEDLYFFIVLNSSGTGGFGGLSPKASINDGMFDFIAVKAKPMLEMAVLFLKILKRDYLHDSNIIYFQDSYVKIEPLHYAELYFKSDIDGEPGPLLPIEIVNMQNAIRIIAPK